MIGVFVGLFAVIVSTESGRYEKKPIYYKICQSSQPSSGEEEHGKNALGEPYELDKSIPTHCPHLIRPKTTPFEYVLPSGLGSTHVIYISGKPPSRDQGFKISFLYPVTCPYQSYVPLRISFDLQERNITRNSEILGDWGVEETQSKCEYSLSPLNIFQLTIRVTDKKFKIYLDGQHCFDFYHRLPHPLISIMKIEGPVQITSLSLL